uniref:Uncharacterized protein n=1 Tax=Anguilla anguilla TaxID=7936 RepID=A0A0E9RY58_ANGAN
MIERNLYQLTLPIGKRLIQGGITQCLSQQTTIIKPPLHPKEE